MENNGFILINLLPYREKIKADKIRQFGLLMGFFALLAGGLIFTGHTYLSVKIDEQESRNKFIEEENKKLDRDIKAIVNLKDEIKETLAKRQVVESLQVNRSDGVNIMNELANQLPEGSVLKSVERVGEKITIVGQTQSNAKVSNYMTNLDATPVFTNPELVEVKAITLTSAKTNSKQKTVADELKINEFTINVTMERKIEPKEEPKKGKAQGKDNTAAKK